MILLVDSGATNSSWKFMVPNKKDKVYKKVGINLSTSNLEDVDLAFDVTLANQVKSIFFFGAGTGDSERENLLKEILSQVFPEVIDISIGSDLYSAGLALSQGEKCVVSILGTGSNCCIFNNSKISVNKNNLGYILGDEGSGFSMGKEVLRKYFYGMMKDNDQQLFRERYNLTRDALVKEVYYSDSKPNTYVASFCDFLSHCSPELRKEVSTNSLLSFFDSQLEQFGNHEDLFYHFSGSISWYFQNEIKEICTKYGYKVGKIIQNPIDSLTYSILSNI